MTRPTKVTTASVAHTLAGISLNVKPHPISGKTPRKRVGASEAYKTLLSDYITYAQCSASAGPQFWHFYSYGSGGVGLGVAGAVGPRDLTPFAFVCNLFVAKSGILLKIDELRDGPSLRANA